MTENTQNVSAPETQSEPEKQNAPKKGFLSKLDSFWGIKESGSNFKTEIVAGIVTFLAMCYILTVNPNQILYGGVADGRWASLFIATAFGAIIGTLLMSFLAKLPLAQASGMGLNSLVGTIIGGGVGSFSAYVFEFSLANALAMVLISGVLFLLLSVISIKGVSLRQKIFDGIPAAIKMAIPVGIGLFIAYIGFQNSGIIQKNIYTASDLVIFSKYDASAAAAAVCVFGILVIAILSHLKIKGAIIFGILAATVLGIPLGVTNLDIVAGKQAGITWKFWENFGEFFGGDDSVFLAAFKGFSFPAGSVFTVIMLVITMCMIDMFDTMGTCVGCCAAAGLLDENGVPKNYNRIMYSDSIATCTGAILGTSTVTTFVESGSGIAAGGKTGLTAFVTAVMFLLAIFLMPFFAMIPSAATAAALIYVGVLMMKNVTRIDFSDAKVAVPAFLTIVIMPFGYSITDGIGIGIVSYFLIDSIIYLVKLIAYAANKQEREKPVWDISVVTIVITALFLVYFLVPAVI